MIALRIPFGFYNFNFSRRHIRNYGDRQSWRRFKPFKFIINALYKFFQKILPQPLEIVLQSEKIEEDEDSSG